jgi:hypothetical protein
MRKLYNFLFIALFYSISIKAQTVSVSGECITGTVILNPIGDIDGKPAYENTGTVDGNANVQIDVFWMPAPDNLWVVAFDGQPYFQNSCNTPLPPATPSSSCSWTGVLGQTCDGANPLSVLGTGTLGVKITGFTARKNNKDIILNWKTSNEINNRGFEIQKSADGINWKKIGFVNGSINSSVEKDYQFADANPFSGKNFYRLLQLDVDNKGTYSSVVSVKFLQQGFYSISNNPGNGLYHLHIDQGTEKINFSVIDANGRKILSKVNNGAQDQTIDITNYSSGIYLLKIQKGNDLFTEKLIKL